MSFFFPFANGWEPVDEAVPDSLKELVEGLSWDGVSISRRSLEFYPDCDFLMFKSKVWIPEQLFIYALRNGDDLIWLNGTSPPLHEFNGRGHLRLTSDNALDYLMFFCFFVRGSEGPFYVIDSLSAPYLPLGLREGTEPLPDNKPELVKNAMKRLQERYQPPRSFGVSDDGRYRISVSVFYSNAIFVADFYVSPNGNCAMHEDTPVMADLPVKIDYPVAPSTEARTVH